MLNWLETPEQTGALLLIYLDPDKDFAIFTVNMARFNSKTPASLEHIICFKVTVLS